jgi:hypothetical protein
LQRIGEEESGGSIFNGFGGKWGGVLRSGSGVDL